MSSVIPFESKSIPAFLQAAYAEKNSDLSAGVSAGGFPILSVDNKIFTIIRNKEKSIVMRPDEPDEPATSLEIVLVKASSAVSKVYHIKAFDPNSGEPASRPDCVSADGVKPDVGSKKPQSENCVTCRHNAWGSDPKGGKGKACREVRRVAVCAAGQLNDPMMLRIPPASLKPLAEYGAMLEKRNTPYWGVVTKLRFHPTEKFQFQFTPVGFLNEEQFEQVSSLRDSDLVTQIVSSEMQPEAGESSSEDVFEQVAEKKEKPAEKKVVEKKEKVVEKPVEKKVESKPVEVTPETDDIMSELDDLLGSSDD